MIRVNNNGPYALGIHWAHDASVSVCSPKGILFSIQEERISRIKHYYGFPKKSILAALDFCNLTPADISIVAFTSSSIFYPKYQRSIIVDVYGRKKRIVSKMQIIHDWMRKNLLEDFGWGMHDKRRIGLEELIKKNWGKYYKRHYLFNEKFLSEIGLFHPRISYYYISHHRAHASSTFRLSGFKNACVVTLDGKGDGLSGTIYKGFSDGQMVLQRASKADDSLGAFYQAVTEALGFIPVDGEYKTMGLAAFGSSRGKKNPFHHIVSSHDGRLKSHIAWKWRSFNLAHPDKKVPNPLSSVSQAEDFERLLKTYSREDLAFFAQKVCERCMFEYVKDAMHLTKSKNIAAAGGVFLNVKGNSLIKNRLTPSAFFVYPDSGDSGLAAGAALEALYQEGFITSSLAWENPFLGTQFTDSEIEKTLQSFRQKYPITIRNGSVSHLSQELTKGKVIGTFQGRLEMGPRTLGNRSVLADPRDISIKDRINRILKGRELFVPFAPVLLKEDAHKYWSGDANYKYMTFIVKANTFAKKTIPAAVHVDGTMRPEVVDKNFHPWVYNLLIEFKRKTGIGVLLNTSFNRHGLPIVASPKDCLEHLINGWVDGISIGNWYVEKGSN
ncbi:hypothetical protein HYW55_03190 [Candidatus Gottesmanbacteria bacterium]|nr:hypothetical protein [Candidatus Gottesmanbacteria bacterium]